MTYSQAISAQNAVPVNHINIAPAQEGGDFDQNLQRLSDIQSSSRNNGAISRLSHNVTGAIGQARDSAVQLGYQASAAVRRSGEELQELGQEVTARLNDNLGQEALPAQQRIQLSLPIPSMIAIGGTVSAMFDAAQQMVAVLNPELLGEDDDRSGDTASLTDFSDVSELTLSTHVESFETF